MRKLGGHEPHGWREMRASARIDEGNDEIRAQEELGEIEKESARE